MPGFSTAAFLGAAFQNNAFQVGSTGHSGVMRLWLSAIQEESLRKDELKKEIKSAVAKSEKTAVLVPTLVKKAAVVRKTEEPFKRRFPPIRFTPAPPDEFEQLPALITLMSAELFDWYKAFEPIRLVGIEVHRRKIVQQVAEQKAANDEAEDEDDLELLLLAA